ncbi:hypothetical protein CYMTET_7136 [Cymbomonas tetramitiformis]|uniref:Uncharacterized protein n=1 Tax=Cymbomonas tetramitiformis TaxID=36881 RepID=A0AAE0GVK4_9CHLO|nr:hypothetical protein CYMTET_7136 [Cymbomonas tetramitiformis]
MDTDEEEDLRYTCPHTGKQERVVRRAGGGFSFLDSHTGEPRHVARGAVTGEFSVGVEDLINSEVNFGAFSVPSDSSGVVDGENHSGAEPAERAATTSSATFQALLALLCFCMLRMGAVVCMGAAPYTWIESDDFNMTTGAVTSAMGASVSTQLSTHSPPIWHMSHTLKVDNEKIIIFYAKIHNTQA